LWVFGPAYAKVRWGANGECAAGAEPAISFTSGILPAMEINRVRVAAFPMGGGEEPHLDSLVVNLPGHVAIVLTLPERGRRLAVYDDKGDDRHQDERPWPW